MIVRAYNLTVKIYISKFNMSVSSKKIFHLLPLVKQTLLALSLIKQKKLPPLVKQIENSTVANSTPPLFILR